MMDAVIQTVEVPSHWVAEGEFRLNASFYSQDVIAARLILEKASQKTEIVKLSGLVGVENIYMPALKITIPFSDYGEPYLTQSEVEFFLPKARKKVDIRKLTEPDKWRVKNGYLLISQSGTIGRVTIATKYLEQFIISPNPIRVITDEKIRGYLYAFLSTWIGSALIKSPKFGITVDHILPHHLYDIPVPRIPGLEEEINQKILKAHRLREEAQELLLKAEEMIYSELGLPKIDEDNVEYFEGDKGKIVKSFELKASDLNLRLDASSHIPILQQIEENLSKSEFEDMKFREVIDKIFIPTRFKRPYVDDPSSGVAFLQGSHIPQIKPMDVKYLWSGTRNLKNILIKKDWVLMTRSGTVGRIGVVRSGWEDWAASEHVLRIIIKPEIHSGYIAAFLSSPYGEYQIKGKIYGAVVDEIGERDTSLLEDINIIVPPKDIRDKIGNFVFEAYDKRDKSNQIEDKAIKMLERRLKEIAAG
ncbi:MAG: restriction endonuclease subunit S [Actinomycetota bacterium]|nr:restriction endonuclease subunit S [Actinomycetota bacterium]